MRLTRCFSFAGSAFACLLVLLALSRSYAQSGIPPEALQQMRELLAEKESRTPVQRKIGTQLVYALKASTGQPLSPGIVALPGAASYLNTSGGGVLVDIRATPSTAVISAIASAGGRIVYASPATGRIRARIPLDQMEPLASRADILKIAPAAHVRTKGRGWAASAQPRPDLFAAAVGRSLMGAKMFSLAHRLGLTFFIGSLSTQGVISHGATSARNTYGASGAGVRVGVLSDSAEATPFLVGTGDLPLGTTIVQDIIDGPGSSEGTAMMEIVYDMAPGVQLFFATAFNGDASFADNIRTLRNTYQCDVIVDDISYSNESPFQDDVIAQAVNDVTASGAIYFSSAGNSGNLTNNNSNTWEGDFVSGGTNALLPGYTVHSFGAQAFNRTLTTTGVLDLFWADPLGASANDYDLFVLNAAGTSILAASLDSQSGAGYPFEEIYVPAGIPANYRIVIVARAGAAARALHLDAFFGEPLQIKTSGATRGHNAGASTVGVAAVAWNSARLGTRPFTGGAANPTEIFSSDGPRRVFFNANGTAITPGNFLFATNGGTVLVKPDIAAADGVTTRTPGFNPFFGTSAAAPHAAAIAAQVKSVKPSLTRAQIYNAMTSTALDIRAPGIDRDSGYGIVMAPASVAKALQ